MLAALAWHVLLAGLLLLGPALAQSAANATEAAALLAFKAALTSASALADWDPATDMCAAGWTGVDCTAGGQVAAL